MAMASACVVLGAVPWKVTLNQWGAFPSSLLSSESSQGRRECASSASSSSSSSSSSSTSPGSEVLTYSGRRGLRQHHRSFFTQRRRRMRVQIAAEAGEGEEPRESESERWSLEELDKQLKVFSAREASLPRQTPVPRQSLGEPEKQQNAVNERLAKLQLPEFTEGFFVYLAIVLLLLTIVNNVVYKFVLHPPAVDRREAYKSTVPVQPRYRITTRQEEREAREAKDAQQEAIAAQSREAPLPSE